MGDAYRKDYAKSHHYYGTNVWFFLYVEHVFSVKSEKGVIIRKSEYAPF